MRILDCYFEKYVESEIKKVTKDDVAILESMITQLFVFASIWSIGTTTTLEGRMKFDIFFREKIKKLGIEFPEEKLVYDYKFNIETKEWQYWMETIPVYSVDIKVSFNEIVVPTVDSIRMKYFAKLLLLNSKHCMMPGPTGVGKSVYI
jgi:dynein heavy chain